MKDTNSNSKDENISSNQQDSADKNTNIGGYSLSNRSLESDKSGGAITGEFGKREIQSSNYSGNKQTSDASSLDRLSQFRSALEKNNYQLNEIPENGNSAGESGIEESAQSVGASQDSDRGAGQDVNLGVGRDAEQSAAQGINQGVGQNFGSDMSAGSQDDLPTHDSAIEHLADIANITSADNPAVTKVKNQRGSHSKKSPKNRKHRGLKVVIMAVAVLCVAFAVVWFTPVGILIFGGDYDGAGDESVEVTINDGDGVNAVAQTLYNAEVVKSTWAFKQAAKQYSDKPLSAGTYTLKKHMKATLAYEALLDPNNVAGAKIVIPEGTKVSDALEIISKATGLSVSDLENEMKNPSDLGLPSEANGSFEGWLFPATYTYHTDQISAKKILSDMVAKTISVLDDLNVAQDQREKILTVASIIEGEVTSEYYDKVARVIYNRLESEETNYTIGMDSVIAYGLNKKASQLTQADLAKDTPYNSRLHKGLPPTPISNPGEETIKAALNPADGDWLYFVTVNLYTHDTKFTASSEEFKKYSEEYDKWLEQNPDAVN